MSFYYYCAYNLLHILCQELNSAVEFTSTYEKLLPIVQTLPQLILHKEVVMNTLLSHLQLSAVHSLEPILR